MKITQIYEIMNTTVQEILGETAVIQEDLSNIVDIGNEIIGTENVDSYVRKLINHIGKTIFNNRVYKGNVPAVFMDSWEYGSILQKISSELPDVKINESWELTDGEDYSQDVFHQPKVSSKFFNSKVTFEIPMSFTERQVKQSFSSKTELNGFLSMLFNSVENAMTLRMDNLIMKTINHMTAETLQADLYSDASIDTTKSGVKAINLLKLYKDKTGEVLTVEKALSNKDFIKHATYVMNLYKDRLTKISTLFNSGSKERFTPASDIKTVVLTDFSSSIGVFSGSELQNKEYLNIGEFSTVPYWQGSGVDYSFEEVSKINLKTNSGDIVEVGGILSVMFDKQALGVTNLDKRVTTSYNAKAEFYTNYYKFDAGYFNDLDENFIVFFVG